jgi:hypothetical protein
MYIQYINLVDKSFRVNNVFLNEQEQFRVLSFSKEAEDLTNVDILYKTYR